MELILQAPTPVSSVLLAYGPKNVACMRVLRFICHPPDATAVASWLTGLSMIGWAPPLRLAYWNELGHRTLVRQSGQKIVKLAIVRL